MVNDKIFTGEVEIEVKELRILNEAKTPPFEIAEESKDINEELRLKISLFRFTPTKIKK